MLVFGIRQESQRTGLSLFNFGNVVHQHFAIPLYLSIQQCRNVFCLKLHNLKILANLHILFKLIKIAEYVFKL